MGSTEQSLAGPEARPAPRPPAERAAALRAWARRRRSLLIALASVLLLGLSIRLGLAGASEATAERSLAVVLARQGIRVREDTVVWLAEDEGGLSMRPALLLAHRDGELDDVWYVEVRPGRDGAIVDTANVANLTHSATAAEEQLLRAGDRAAFASSADGRVEALTVLDLRGEEAESLAGFTRVQRVQHAITSWQETGRFERFGLVRYALHAPEAGLVVGASEREITLRGAQSATVVGIDPETLEVREGADAVDVMRDVASTPQGITWVVDTVRATTGPAPIEWLESRVFAVADWWNRNRYAMVGEDTEAVVAEEMGVTEVEITEERRALLTAAEAEIGFPPPPMEPVITTDAVEGEGEWIAVIDDPFVNQYPGAPPAFAQSFVRPDLERPYVRVYVTLWDPRQVQLRIVAGQREPESASGDLGSGWIPRDEATVRGLVGAFDGGFQALHGEFGMMSEGRVYLPPKPWAATVAVFDDGRVGMGSWPAPNWRGRYYDERLANRQIPPGMIEMRQNLTSMVEDGVWNPWERWWWGAAPQESEEQTFTYRSGMCLTREGFLAFFWGSSLGPEALGQAMIAARCARAMHLDMNSGHCGFEFFRPYRADGPPPPPVERVHAEYEHDDVLRGAPGWRVRGRKAVRSMAMRFPRYTDHDARDFFYLTLRPVLPGPALAGGEAFSSAGLPHAGWPYAFARARRGESWVVRIDPRRAVPSPIRQEHHARAIGAISGAPSGPVSLIARRAVIGWELAVGEPGQGDRVIVSGTEVGAGTGAAIGVDRDGLVVYVEGGDVLGALAAAGVARAVGLPPEARLALIGEGGSSAPDGETPRDATGAALTLLAEERAETEVLWPDNQPMPYSHWGYLQGQRVRYFPTGTPRFVRDAGAR